MRLLSSIKRRPKHAEATTDESQKSASSWKNTFKLLHWPRRKNNIHQPEPQRKLELQNIETADDDCTESGLDVFQTLMSNAAAAPPLPPADAPDGESDIAPSKHRRSLNYWHTNDPNFLPTAYPLTRMDPRSHPKAKWGSLNLAASAALVAGQLKRFDLAVRDKRPRFRLGPRPPIEENEDARSVSSHTTDRSRSAVLETSEPKYTFIAQDGKLVERELYRWPKQEQPKLTLRYKLCEPYASNYGKKAAKRASTSGQKCAQARVRWIYERPIFRLPRSVVNENKCRLLSRHMLKDQHEPTPCYRLPCSIKLNESEQFMRFREYQTVKYIKDVRSRIAHEEALKSKANAEMVT